MGNFLRFAASCFAALWIGACCSDDPPACKNDTDCKGDRVCTDGKCHAPAAPASPPPVAAPTQAASRIAAIVQPPATNNRGVVRSSPAFDAPKITELDRGEAITIVGQSPDRMWRKIQWQSGEGGEGWMHRDVIAEPGSSPRPAAVSGPRPGGPCVEGATEVACTCAGGGPGSMACFGRSLTWSSCDCR